MKLSDYVIAFLESKGIKHMFYLAGGGCMHLLNSLASSSKIEPVAMMHEQAVAVACEAYANTTGQTAAALVTSGPGGTNALTGVLAAYLDSSPCFFVSGQMKTADLKSRYGVRSLGSQEADITALAAPITKYAATVLNKGDIRYHLERAWYEAGTGRRGPVWLDIPLDIQGANIEPENLKGFTPDQKETAALNLAPVFSSLNKTKRPVAIIGNGLSQCKEDAMHLLEELAIPVIPSWKAMDYIACDHPLYAGKAGGMGDRFGNLAMQNADLILSLGCRLDFSITGYERRDWAPKAEKIVVEIDPAEIHKLEDASLITPVICDAADFVHGMLENKKLLHMKNLSPWKEQLKAWRTKYPTVSKEKYTNAQGELTTYALVDTICAQLPANAHVAPCSSGTTAEIFFQAFTNKQGQKIRSNHGLGSMGFDLPNAIGMCVASGVKDVVCVTGDGGVQLNLQELAVVQGRKLPIKLFVVNNNGYASIRNMQDGHFAGNHCGCDCNSGMFLPDMQKIAMAYDIKFIRIARLEELEDGVQQALEHAGAVLCEVVVETKCLVTPRTATKVLPDGSMRSSALEDQFPFLDKAELAANILS